MALTLGEKVKQLRKDARLTQFDFAEILQIAPSTLACYETDRRVIPYDILKAIARYFDVSTDYLLGMED